MTKRRQTEQELEVEAAGEETEGRQGLPAKHYREWLTIIDGLRKKAGMSRKDLAIRARRDPSNVSRYFSGKKTPTIATIKALSLAVGFDVETALRQTRVLPPKHHDPEIETLFARAESALLGMSADERRIEVEALEHRARNAKERQRAIIGKDDPLPFSASANGTTHINPC